MIESTSTPPAAEPEHTPTDWLRALRISLVAALVLLVLAIAALAYVVSFEAIRAFAVETAAFPADLGWSAPLLVDTFTTAATLVILWRYLRGDAWWSPWYAWTLVACATAVSVALNVAHAPDRLDAEAFAALPPVALLAALELLMSVARAVLPQPEPVGGSVATPLPTPSAGPAPDPTPPEPGRPAIASRPRPAAAAAGELRPDVARRARELALVKPELSKAEIRRRLQAEGLGCNHAPLRELVDRVRAGQNGQVEPVPAGAVGE